MSILHLIFWVFRELCDVMTVCIQGEIPIRVEGDIVLVRKTIREASGKVGFGGTDITRIVTAVSELARNIYKYAGSGYVKFYSDTYNGKPGITIYFVDRGPGIEDLSKALRSGYSTSDGLGMGLPGSKRLMDTMVVQSHLGQGTTIKVSKWLN